MCIKLSIITAGILPIPAFKGGGVETLVQDFIDENEKRGEFDIELYTIAGAERMQEAYKYTTFINIKRNYYIDKIVKLLNPLLYALNRHSFKFPNFRILDSYEKKLIKILKKDKSDILIFENNLILLSSINKKDVKIIFHAHYDDVRSSLREFDKKRYQYCYKKISANIGVSTFINKRIQDVIGNHIKYYTVHNCIDYCKFAVNIQEDSIRKIKEKYGIPINKTIIMYSGRITKEKGIGQLVDAFKLINEDACLVIVGGSFYSDNTETEYVLNLKEEARCSKNPIIFTGYIQHDKMPEMWALSDIVVVPTYEVEEAAGLVVIEAMASGKPVIISDSGAMSEYINSECSFLVKRGEDFIVKLAESIELLCKNELLRKSMGNNALYQAKKWDKCNYYRNMSTVIKDVLDEG